MLARQLTTTLMALAIAGQAATALLWAQEVPVISVVLTNRDNDLVQAPNSPNIPPNGTNLDIQSGAKVVAPWGIVLGSASAVNNHEAGRIQANSGSVTASVSYARASNVIGGAAFQNWRCVPGGSYCPPTVADDGPLFNGPVENAAQKGFIAGQPPIYGSEKELLGDVLRPVPGGLLTNAICTGGSCEPGIYYATEPDCNGCVTSHPSGAQLRTSNNAVITFAGVREFERYIFVGGLNLSNGTNATLGPGRYVFAGVMDAATPVFQTASNVTLMGGNGSDAGRVLIFTDFRRREMRFPNAPGATPVSSYAGQIESIWDRIQNYGCPVTCDWKLTPWANTGLKHGPVDIQAGRNGGSQSRLYGLRSANTGVPLELRPYGPLLLWQDQHNSYVGYQDNAQLDQTCGGDVNSPCLNTPDHPEAPMLSIWNHAGYAGTIYQPRGAWMKLQGAGQLSLGLIITGAIIATQ